MREISVSLTEEGIENLIKELSKYRRSLTRKNMKFLKLLLDCGIEVAEQSIQNGTHTMPERITFSKEFTNPDTKEVVALLVGVGETFFSNWKDASGIEHHDEVYPLAMMEFGSAGLALPPQNIYGGIGGRGTFSVSGHENDLEWYFDTGEVDEKGKPIRKYATAINPTQPMYNAMIEMQNQIRDCAVQAFGGD